jgi:hypothetical protein
VRVEHHVDAGEVDPERSRSANRRRVRLGGRDDRPPYSSERDVRPPFSGRCDALDGAHDAAARDDQPQVAPPAGHELLDDGPVAAKPAAPLEPPQLPSQRARRVAEDDVPSPAAEAGLHHVGRLER